MAALSVAACGTFLSTSTDEPAPNVGSGVDAASDGATIDGPGTDPPSSCDGYVPPTDVVYVAPAPKNPLASCGTKDAPCTLETALAGNLLGTNSIRTLHLAPGRYEYASLKVTSPVRLVGGWTETWERDCDSSKTTLASRTDNVAIHVGDPDARGKIAVTLASLALESPSGTAGASQTRYGVLAVNTTLTLDHVDIKAGDGGVGANASAQPVDPAPVNCTLAPGTTNGATGGTGSAGSIVFFDNVGGVAALTGGPGSPGVAGSNAAPPAETPWVKCTYFESTCSSKPCSEVPTVPPTNGCGGRGGLAGAGGGSGGSSIGIYAVSSDVTVRGGSITTGNGGNGGAGGMGGSGLPGSAGNPGERWTTSCRPPGSNCADYLEPGTCEGADVTAIMPASAGGPALAGGSGGPGGGGAGGFSLGYVLRSGASIAIEPAQTPIKLGAAGTGGLPNGPSGATRAAFP